MGRNDKKWRRKKITKHKHRKMLKKTRHRINK
ncbi:MAG: 30S ribosomal protein bS22 [Candidatus Hodarchaeales archaeon]